MGMHPSMSTMVTPPNMTVPAVLSNFYPLDPQENAYSYGPPYFQDPFLASRQLVSPYPMISQNHGLPHGHHSSIPRVTSPVNEDDTSTIHTTGVHDSAPQDFLSQGCQVLFGQSSAPLSVSHASAGCQVSSFSSSTSILPDHSDHILVWDKVKFTLPSFDSSKMEWSNYATKIWAALCKCKMSYILSDSATNSTNAKHSKELCLELYDKLIGPALQLFKSLATQDYYMEGGCGIEMVHLLAATFNPMDSSKHCSLLLKLISVTLPEDMELLEFINLLKDTNMQLSWCGTGMLEYLLVDIAMHRLESSRYKRDISHTATGSGYNT
jgi:hypothetical protein